jgi:hypothetical protein
MEPDAFAAAWCDAWNSHDLEAILAHFTDDVVFSSPAARSVLGGDGVVRGKSELRTYWGTGLGLIPDLHFEVQAVYAGVDTIVINYRNQVGKLVCEVLLFAGDLVREGHGTYIGTFDVQSTVGASG